MSDDPYKDLLGLIARMDDQGVKLQLMRSSRQDELWSEYQRAVKTDETLLRLNARIDDVKKAIKHTIDEVLIAGTVIKYCGFYYVVMSREFQKRMDDGCLACKSVTGLCSRTSYLRLGSETDMTIVNPDTIEDTELRRKAKRVVAKIRFEKW